EILAQQKSKRDESGQQLLSDETANSLGRRAAQVRKLSLQLLASLLQIVYQKRRALDASQEPRNHEVQTNAQEASQYHQIKTEHQPERQQTACVGPTVKQNHYSCDNAQVGVRKQPISKRSLATSIHLSSHGVCHDPQYPDQAGQSGDP